MERVSQLDTGNPPADIWIGLCLIRVDAEQRHIGLLYRQEERGPLRFLHLAWHHKLKDDFDLPKAVWANPDIPPARLRQVAGKCREIWKANENRIPYAFSSPNDIFDANSSEILLGPTQHGLTCASLVLAIFQISGWPLVRIDQWPVGREADEKWQESIVNLLQKSGASEDHIHNVRSQIGSVRFRPEEVAAAAVQSPHPRSFEQIESLSLEILEFIQNQHRQKSPASET